MVTDAQMRAIALELPGTRERSHFGHPDFRVNNRIFATLWPDQQRCVLRLSMADQAAALESFPDVLAVPTGAGRACWTRVDLEKISDAGLRELLKKAWASVPRPRPRKEVARKRAGAGV